MPELSKSLKQIALDELQSKVCPGPCGGNFKKPRRSFCYDCFMKLPQKMRSALYTPFACALRPMGRRTVRDSILASARSSAGARSGTLRTRPCPVL